ncbi:hypothetical protein Ana3638_17025 [Anaerocolumna sedimenticola]|uniref:Uncharacterized protein n=1 Tax=Anaerocolumna sedimenticola TaxID=2696063 RepID=A0A6P1TRB3_9FIRM|nr:hypothetical protein [Anaerocolumna sedimenticola]QHQ62276.1 hypothetical protein Ana3638_17025 [Anaerocolumna sedimenticola]
MKGKQSGSKDKNNEKRGLEDYNIRVARNYVSGEPAPSSANHKFEDIQRDTLKEK